MLGRYLLQKHGKRAMIDAEKQRDRHLDQMTRNAKAFVLEGFSKDPVRASSRPDC